MLVGETAFFGKTLRGKKIGVTVAGEVFDPYIPFGNQVFQIGIDQADSNAETAGKFTLGKRLFAADFRKQLERAG